MDTTMLWVLVGLTLVGLLCTTVIFGILTNLHDKIQDLVWKLEMITFPTAVNVLNMPHPDEEKAYDEHMDSIIRETKTPKMFHRIDGTRGAMVIVDYTDGTHGAYSLEEAREHFKDVLDKMPWGDAL